MMKIQKKNEFFFRYLKRRGISGKKNKKKHIKKEDDFNAVSKAVEQLQKGSLEKSVELFKQVV